jgi:serine protease Do
MNCTRCGGQVWPQDLFCPRCGTPVSALASGTPPQPARPSTSQSRTILLALIGVLVVALGVTVGVLIVHQRSGPDAASKTALRAAPQTHATTTSPTVSALTTTASAPADFAAVYSREQSGVVRIEVLGCSESGIGTGFLLSPTLIATVDHVVVDSLVVSLIDGDQRTTGQVVGSDPLHDLALVRADSPLTGYNFRFAATEPAVGDRVAAIGFPIGDPITLTQGGISGLDRDIEVEGEQRTGMIETDAAVNPGNSGGPLLAPDGTVFGLVDALNTAANGIAYAVPSGQAQPAMTSWQQAPTSQPPATCQTPLGPSQVATSIPAIPSLTDEASVGIGTAFETYFDGINSGDYQTAYNVLSPRLRAGSTAESFASGDATSYDFGQGILDARQIDSATAHVALEFTSLQSTDKGPDGDACDVWTLLYTMVEGSDGAWYIDSTKPYRGSSHTPC